MILTIDMGNTNIVIGGIDEKQTYFEERITTIHSRTSTEYALLIKDILDLHSVDKNQIEGSIVSSVVPPLNAPIQSALKKILGGADVLDGRFRHENRLKYLYGQSQDCGKRSDCRRGCRAERISMPHYCH